MATMINCATDWSFDRFAEAMDSVEALPMRHGVRPSRNLSDEQIFCVYVKTAIKFADFDAYYDVEDAIKEALYEMNFSDWYKDTFNQRPHFGVYLVGALCGVYGAEWRCALWTWKDPIETYKGMAREVREYMHEMARNGLY